MDENKLQMAIESLLFVSRSPVQTSTIAKLTGASGSEVRKNLIELKKIYSNRGIVIEEVAGGWQFRTNPACREILKKYLQARPIRLTKAGIETLSIIAYLQPVTKVRIEEIRGVDSSGVIKFLIEHGLVKIIGKKEEPGRPYLYGTTRYFLEMFGLKSLKDLPKLKEHIELSEEEISPIVEHSQEGEEEKEEKVSGEQFYSELASILEEVKAEEKKEQEEKRNE